MLVDVKIYRDVQLRDRGTTGRLSCESHNTELTIGDSANLQSNAFSISEMHAKSVVLEVGSGVLFRLGEIL